MRYERVPYLRNCAAPLANTQEVTVTIGICLRRIKTGTIAVRQSRCYGLMRATPGGGTIVARNLCVALIVLLRRVVHIRNGIILDPLWDLVMAHASSAA
jgi:hypothetical protein